MVGLRSPTHDPQAGTPGAPDLVPPYGHAVRDPDIISGIDHQATAGRRLFPEVTDHALPFIGHKLVAAIGRVYTVPNPVVSRSAFYRLVEDGLKPH